MYQFRDSHLLTVPYSVPSRGIKRQGGQKGNQAEVGY